MTQSLATKDLKMHCWDPVLFFFSFSSCNFLFFFSEIKENLKTY